MKLNLLALHLNLQPATAPAGPATAALSGYTPLARVTSAVRESRTSAAPRSQVSRLEPVGRAESLLFGFVAASAALPVGVAMISTANFAANFENVLAWVRAFGL